MNGTLGLSYRGLALIRRSLLRNGFVGPKLNQLNAPTLIMSARHDPMVPYASLRPFLVGRKRM